MNRPRWLSFILVFIILTFFWISLAAAASPLQTIDRPVQQAVPGILHPGNHTFGIIVGAIILVTIVVTSAVFHKARGS